MAAATASRLPAILVFSDFYLPGIKSGGAMRTLENMVQHLGDRFEFRFLTRDRDVNTEVPYDTVRIGAWNTLTRESVYYLPPERLTLRAVGRLMRETPHDAVYLNSFFSVPFTLLPVLADRLGLGSGKPILLAPRGELSDGALANKSRAKTLYLKAVRALGIFRKVRWQASTDLERDEIRKWFGPGARVSVACDFPAKDAPAAANRTPKPAGTARVVFLSRIDYKKNLLGALEILAEARGRVSLDIHGPVADGPYWEQCRARIATLPPHITVNHYGPVDTREVVQVFSRYDLFLFPTFGENFGHVILESLTAGTPVLLSDRTPWTELEANGAGWTAPLGEPRKFIDILQRLVDMDPDEYGIICRNAAGYALRVKENPAILADNMAMFTALLPASKGTT